MCRLLLSISLLIVLSVGSGGVAEAREEGPSPRDIRVTVALVLLEAPSEMDITTDLESLGTEITELSQLIPGSNVYLEAWCQTPGPNGIVTAAVDLSYETVYFDSSTEQVWRAPQWDVLPFEHSVDDAAGWIDDLGGNNFSGLGVEPDWAKIGTVEFDVTATPPSTVTFCSHFAGTFGRFAIYAEGAVDPSEVDYGCCSVGPVDSDGDGVPDEIDNCPDLYNPAHEEPYDCNDDGDTEDPGEGAGEQCDVDDDGIGDACDDDIDGDGVPNECDPDQNPGPDCQPNGILDSCDVDPGDPDGDGQVSLDVNANGVPDECDCIGDLDGDGDRDLADLAQLLANYGTTSGATYEDGDIDADGDVDLADLAALLAHYGEPCP